MYICKVYVYVRYIIYAHISHFFININAFEYLPTPGNKKIIRQALSLVCLIMVWHLQLCITVYILIFLMILIYYYAFIFNIRTMFCLFFSLKSCDQ